MKNPTPKRIAFNTALLLTAIGVVVSLVMHLIFADTFEWYLPLLIGLLTLLTAYFLFLFAIEKFIYRKIKLIYKTIHNLKATKGKMEAVIDLDKDIISEVNAEVMEWAADKKQEIDKLKELAKYRREFLGNVSHELKTPIFTVQGYVHTLLDGGINDPKINKEYLYKASRSVDRLNAIVEDLETITQLESGKLKLETEKFDLVLLTKEVFESLEVLAEANDITLGFKDDYPKPINVLADKERIRQVLVNLIGNSIKYGKEGGNTLVGCYDMDENFLVEVTDNGIGIDKEHLPRLFERFYRTDKGRSREKGGTGLGLAIVKHIIEAHEQAINVRSTVGVGTTFGFTLKKV